ncbi:hypothetical protein GMRT_14035 [Giardia muris]|uniref:Uncharacterized protein n=1 Tax=Giardia muris TaxID=5742 RepID=A0A4Z1SNA2_GIAMU|nr:hypothetical protein GMRT_14035 [Giardia muris]|eukprot:TNJ27206.1 hypothetical protein GMRT_14035 [Giardia muris]
MNEGIYQLVSSYISPPRRRERSPQENRRVYRLEDQFHPEKLYGLDPTVALDDNLVSKERVATYERQYSIVTSPARERHDRLMTHTLSRVNDVSLIERRVNQRPIRVPVIPDTVRRRPPGQKEEEPGSRTRAERLQQYMRAVMEVEERTRIDPVPTHISQPEREPLRSDTDQATVIYLSKP